MTTWQDDDRIPEAFAQQIAGRAADATLVNLAGADAVDGDTWLRSLPAILDDLLASWRLRVVGPSQHGTNALAIPVVGRDDTFILKVGWPHAEARHEHLALRAWNGRGAVQLIAADPHRWALLLERARPATALANMPALDACEVIGSIHARLNRPALPQLDTTSAWAHRLRERLTTSPPPLPRRFLDQGIALARDLPKDADVDARLVHSDLYDDNVLAAPRPGSVDGLIAIAPKPIAAEPAFALAPLVWNRKDEAADAYNLRNHLRFRIDYACDPMDVDPARARAWTLLRLLDNAWREARHSGARADMTRHVTMIKAMQG